VAVVGAEEIPADPCQLIAWNDVHMNAPVRAETLTPDTRSYARRPIIQFHDVSKTFEGRGAAGKVHALQHVNFAVDSGDVFGIIGRSGAGKSTLIRLVNGLERPTSGRILVGGTDISSFTERQLITPRRKIGMIFQHFNLLAMRTVHDNVALPLEVAGRSRAEIAQRVEPLLELVGLSDKRDRYPAELSGGQKQRVGIARALSTDPNVLLCDEATSALDPETTSSILALLSDVNKKLGVSIVLITHEIPVIQAICNRVAVIEAGRIVEQGRVLDVFLRPSHPTTESFVGAITGLEMPEHLQAGLRHEAQATSRAILRIVASGHHKTSALITRLSDVAAGNLDVLTGRVGTISNEPFCGLVASVPAKVAGSTAFNAALAEFEAEVRIAGYVD